MWCISSTGEGQATKECLKLVRQSRGFHFLHLLITHGICQAADLATEGMLGTQGCPWCGLKCAMLIFNTLFSICLFAPFHVLFIHYLVVYLLLSSIILCRRCLFNFILFTILFFVYNKLINNILFYSYAKHR